MRMLMNNLDEDVAERPQDCCLWRHGEGGSELGLLSRYRPGVKSLGERRDFARAIRQTSRSVQDARIRSPRADCELESRRAFFQLGEVQRTGAAGLMMYGR